MEQEIETVSANNGATAMSFVAESEFKEIGSDEQMTDLYVALGMARSEFEAVEKNRISGKGTNKEFAYADLDASLSATVPALARHGLVVLQPLTLRGGLATLRTILAHKGGGRLVAMFDVPLPLDGDVQTFGKNVTYSRKYQYNALVCIAADQDLDESGDSQQSFRGKQTDPKASTERSSGAASSTTSSQLRTSNGHGSDSSKSAQSQASTQDEGPRRLNQTEKAELTKLVREIHGLDPADVEGVKAAVGEEIAKYTAGAGKQPAYVVNVTDYKPLHALLFARAVKAKQDRSAEGPQS